MSPGGKYAEVIDRVRSGTLLLPQPQVPPPHWPLRK